MAPRADLRYRGRKKLLGAEFVAQPVTPFDPQLGELGERATRLLINEERNTQGSDRVFYPDEKLRLSRIDILIGLGKKGGRRG